MAHWYKFRLGGPGQDLLVCRAARKVEVASVLKDAEYIGCVGKEKIDSLQAQGIAVFKSPKLMVDALALVRPDSLSRST